MYNFLYADYIVTLRCEQGIEIIWHDNFNNRTIFFELPWSVSLFLYFLDVWIVSSVY